MTQVEADKIIERLKNGCVYHRFDKPGVYAEYVRTLAKYDYKLMDKAVDAALEEDSRNVPPKSALVKAYKKLAEENKAGAVTVRNEQYCDVCDDKGFVLMTEMHDIGKGEKLPYQYVLYCPFCDVGRAQAYDGRQCKEKSEYFVPPLSQYFDDTAIANIRKVNKGKQRRREQGICTIPADELEEIRQALAKVGMDINKMPWAKSVKAISDADDSEFYEKHFDEDGNELPF